MARNTMSIGVKLTNFSECAQVLRNLPASVESRVMGDAVNHAMDPILEIARARVPVKTGALKRSLTKVVRRYPGKGKILGLVGPDRDYYKMGKRVKEGDSRKGSDRPANYAHLVEYGHYSGIRTGVWGGYAKGSSRKAKTAIDRAFIIAQPFIRPAAAIGGPLAIRELAAGVKIGQQRELGRLKSKIKRINTSR